MQVDNKNINNNGFYELVYFKEGIEILLGELIDKFSIRRSTKTYTYANNCEEVVNMINSSFDWKGNKIYEDVIELKEEVDRSLEQQNNGLKLYSFMSNRLVSPKLVGFLADLISDKKIDYDWFVNRKEFSEKEDLLIEMGKLNSEIDSIDNYDTENKIFKLRHLGSLKKKYDSIPNFDFNELKKYYDLADKYMRLDDIQNEFKSKQKVFE